MGTDLQDIGNRIRKARLSRHITQQQLAEAADISLSFLSNIENGRQCMNIRTFIAISEALNVSADWLIHDTPPTSHIAEEIEKELTSCTPKEREAILNLVQQMKQSLTSLKEHNDE